MESTLSHKVGLANLGNTCFLNVVLQALRFCPPMGSIFLKEAAHLRSDSKKKGMVVAFQTLLRDFWMASSPPHTYPTLIARGFQYSLVNLLRETGDDWYRSGQQADAAEALQYVLDSLHDGMYRQVRMAMTGGAATEEEKSHEKAINSWIRFFGKEFSPIVSNFNGQTQICVECAKCKARTERYEPWLMLKAPIPGGDTPGAVVPTMADCLGAGFAPETLDDYDCEACKTKGKATIFNRISRLPPVTILTLKRFTNMGRKVRGKITWDLDALDLTPYMAFRRDPFRNSRDPPIYTTFAVIEHHGSAHGGHYRMYARQGDIWNEYDDSSVRSVHPDSVVTMDSYVMLLMPKKYAETMNADYAKAIEEYRKVATASAATASAATASAATASAATAAAATAATTDTRAKEA
jgi:ubiquitin C-terminal hydrolase